MGRKKKRHGRRPGRIEDEFAIQHPNAGGIDIGAREIWVSVPPHQAEESVRPFSTLTPGLLELVEWLKACGVDSVVMESTGVYWVPLYEICQEHEIDVNLVNAHHVKNVPGRKSDVLDCQWLRKLHTFGLLRSSFRPTAEIVQLRSYLRQRDTLVRQAADHIRRMQKALTLMNVLLHNVITDITGKTGMTILRAIVAGEHDPTVLAKHRDYRCRSTRKTIVASLTGNYQPEHIFALRHAIKLYDTCQALIAECDRATEEVLDAMNARISAQRDPLPKLKTRKRRAKEPAVDYATRLYTLTGVDLTIIPGFGDYSAACLLAEIGTDMTKWRTVKQFTSWLRLVPRSDITGGKPKNRRTLPGSPRAGSIIRMAAVSAGRTRTAIGAFYRRMAARKEKMEAVVATAHKLARIIYTMLLTGSPFVEVGVEAYEAQVRDRQVRYLKRRAKSLGFTVLEEAA